VGTSLHLANSQESKSEGAPRVILCVSADAGDGKSTLVGALALAWGQAGERVAVVEADFRRPVQAKLLGVDGTRGLADALNGRLSSEEAMQAVSLIRPDGQSSPAIQPDSATATVTESTGSVSVLAGGTDVANPPALIARPAMNELLRSLAENFDHVLIDAPAPLQVSDVIPLLAMADGIVIVARVGHTSERSAERLLALLKNTPSAPVLGVVANAVPGADIKKYGFSSAPNRGGWRQTLIGR